MSNQKEMPKQTYAKPKKLCRDRLLAIKWRDVRDVYILSTAHDDSMVDAPASRRAHKKTKPRSVMSYNKYKIGVEKLDQLLSYYSFQRKSEVVEKTVLSSLWPCSSKCAHFALNKGQTEVQTVEVSGKGGRPSEWRSGNHEAVTGKFCGKTCMQRPLCI
jgi:hypothetical protein